MAALHLLLPPQILSGHGPPPLLRYPRRPSPLLHLLPRAAVAATGTSAASALSTPSDAALQNFRRWLSTHGADTGAVAPAVVPEGLGLVAARSLPRGEVVAEVPKKLWMDADAVAASDIGRVCGGAGDLRPWVSVSLLILREAARGGDSLWAPYLAILPRQTDSTIFWSEQELLEIQGTQLLSTTMGVKEYVQSEFDNVEATIIAPNKDLFPGTITCDDFLWAFGVLRSRVFPELRGDKLALIPFADLINHDGDITSKEPCWEIKGKGFLGRDVVFSLRTPVEVKSGEQVYVQYDLDKSNAELALDYGFTEWNSSRDSYTLTLEISESDPFYGDKLDIAELNGMGETAYFDIVLGESLPPQMIPYLRLLCLGGTDAFLLEALFRNKVWDHLELPVSRDNEESICQVIQKACKSALAAYHTTIEEDEELLEREDLQSRHQIAIEVRIGEKKVLQHAKRRQFYANRVSSRRRRRRRRASGARSSEMTGKAKPKKHTAKELAAKADAALTNRGGGKAGQKDRLGQEKGGHAKMECPLCKVTAPDVKSMQIHHEARHPKIPFDPEKINNLHGSTAAAPEAAASSSKPKPGVRGSLKKTGDEQK